jgi:hypothetical protein
MKRLLLLVIAISPLFAQEDRPVRYFPTDPVNPCSVITPLVNNWILGKLWQCVGTSGINNGTWQLIQGGGSMVYPGAGVANSTGSAWGTSYAVGTAANDLVKLDGSARLPAVSATLLTNLPITLTTTGSSGASTYNPSTNTLNVPQYTASGGGGLGSAPCSPITVTAGAATLVFSSTVNCNYLTVIADTTITLPTPSGNASGPYQIQIINSGPVTNPVITWSGSQSGLPTSIDASGSGNPTNILMAYLNGSWSPWIASAPAGTPLSPGAIFAAASTGPPVAATAANVVSLFPGGHNSNLYGLATDGSQQLFGSGSSFDPTLWSNFDSGRIQPMRAWSGAVMNDPLSSTTNCSGVGADTGGSLPAGYNAGFEMSTPNGDFCWQYFPHQGSIGTFATDFASGSTPLTWQFQGEGRLFSTTGNQVQYFGLVQGISSATVSGAVISYTSTGSAGSWACAILSAGSVVASTNIVAANTNYHYFSIGNGGMANSVTCTIGATTVTTTGTIPAASSGWFFGVAVVGNATGQAHAWSELEATIKGRSLN